jgi:hypothetical protein
MAQPELRTQNNDNNPTGDQLQMEVPQILKIQMNFKPIAQHSKEGGPIPKKGLTQPIIVSEIIANSYLKRTNLQFSE